jgi:uncharacterized protein (UPF0262 family)
MTEPERLSQSLMPVLMRFSADSATIRRLVLSDEGFRTIVEDYLLAHATLHTMQKQMPSKPETIEEYMMLLRDLEGEINKYLTRWRGAKL